MKRIFLLLAVVATFFVAACTSESSLPNPTGKGAISAINGIPGSPEVTFLIEQRLIGGIRYQNSSPPVEYDDFTYNFNFEYANPGETVFTPLATQNLKIDADKDHVLFLSGTLDAPTITVWVGDSREFAEADTVFEVRFANASSTLGNVDVYFEDATIAPGTNPPTATLAFGEIADAIDFESATSYVMTVTAAGDPSTVHFTSAETSLLPKFAHVMSIFDGDETNTAPVLVRSMTSVGNPLTLTDATYPPQLRVVHGASTLQAVDVYDDDMLTNLVIGGLDFKGATAYLDTAAAPRTFYFTPAGSTATILFEQDIPTPVLGSYSDFVLVGDTDVWSAIRVVPNRALVANAAKIRMFHAALNTVLLDIYVVDRDAGLTSDNIPLVRNAAFAVSAPTILIPEGDIDLYVTAAGEQTVVAGPYPVDATLNSTVDLLLVDTVDPLVAEIIDITTP
jgi:hypothetical protein